MGHSSLSEDDRSDLWRVYEEKHFVATKDVFFVCVFVLLFFPPDVCRDKHVFVATKMILVAAPANDI